VDCFLHLAAERLDLAATRLLLVDDDPLLGMLIGDWLSEIGCVVVGPVESAAKALAVIASEGVALDGALLDVTLREGDSYEVADALGLRGVPYAFVTGHGVDGLAPAYRRSLVLSKPFMPEDLQKMITRLLEQKES
jgi:CheY-like chemotaxis protein